MNKRARQFFVKWIEAKYSLGVDLKQDEHHYNIIREMDIFQAIRRVPNVWMVPGSYNIEIPKPSSENIGHVEVREPWGPTVTFKFQSRTLSPYEQSRQQYTTGHGDPTVIKTVENALNASLGQYIHTVGIQYDTNGIYDVTIVTNR